MNADPKTIEEISKHNITLRDRVEHLHTALQAIAAESFRGKEINSCSHCRVVNSTATQALKRKKSK